MITQILRIVRSKKVIVPLAIILMIGTAHWIKTHRQRSPTAPRGDHQLAPVSPLPGEMSPIRDTISTIGGDTATTPRKIQQPSGQRSIVPFNPRPYEPPPKQPYTKSSSPFITEPASAPSMTLYQRAESEKAVSSPEPAETKPSVQESSLTHQLLGRIIPCVLINGIQSSSRKVPIEAWVTEDVWAGSTRLIPRRTTIQGTLVPGRDRDRVHADGQWELHLDDGTRASFTGQLLHRDLDPITEAYGRMDMTLGLKGKLHDTPDLIAQKRILASLASALSQSTQETVHTVFGPRASRNLGNVARDTVDALSSQYQRTLDQKNSQDHHYVEINAATEFYILPRTSNSLAAHQQSKGPIHP